MNDLKLLQTLANYRKENAALSKVAANKLAHHLWYLSEKLVGLSFFNSALEQSKNERWLIQ